jgi:3-hydroxyacyl-[acyl-carrier-protein] dehydratase
MGTLRDDVRNALEHEERDGDLVRARFRFSPELPVFAGHFPGAPIVPGVYMIEAARYLGERACGTALRIAAIEEAKFTASVRPGEEIVIDARLSGSADAYAYRATATANGRTAAKIRLGLVALSQPITDGAHACNA